MSKRCKVLACITIVLIIIVTLLALIIGRYTIDIKNIFKVLFTNNENYNIDRLIVFNLRLPRTLLALLVGCAISISGLLYQEIFQNKLVSPDLLGVSNGAGVGAALAIILGLSNVLICTFAFSFGLITVFLTIFIYKIFKSRFNLMLVLSGIIVSGFMSSILSLIKYCANEETQLSDITYWLMGSFADATYQKVIILFIVTLICVIVLMMIRWRINIVALGKEQAITKGVNYSFYRYLIIIIATLLTGISVSFCGTIAWIGLVLPHIIRLFVGRDNVNTVPLTCLFGSLFMVIVDIISRTFTQSEIPLSAVTGLFGTIVFVIILIYNRRKEYEC